MADINSLQAAFDQFALDQKVRDEGLRRAFGLLRDAMLRMQEVLDQVHEAATKEPAPSGVPGLLKEIKALLEAQPNMIASAVRDGLNQHRA